MKPFTFAALVLATLYYPGAAIAANREKAPNIVVVLADDFGYGDAQCYNPKGKIPTPNIDRLAKEGMRFTDAHSASSVCSPSRYALLTGRYAWRSQLQKGLLHPYEAPIIARERLTVPALLAQHGYLSACIGKWHLGWDRPQKDGKYVFDQALTNGPTTRGFHYYFGTDMPNHPPYCFIENDRTVGQPTAMKEKFDLNGRPGPMLPGWKFEEIMPKLVEKSVAYLGERAKDGKPFFLYFPLTSPHEPVFPSAQFKGKSGISDLADFMMETDAALGQVLDALDKHKLAQDTLIIFSADNGHATYTGLPELQKHGHEPSAHLRGYKSDVYEGGHCVPYIARWPGKIKAGSTCDDTVCQASLLATCAALLKAKLPDDAGVDSFSILPLLLEEKAARPTHEAVVHHTHAGHFAIRQGKWKLALCPHAGARPITEKEALLPPVQLFDLEKDPGETKNVKAENAEVVARLTKLLEKYVADGRSTTGKAQKNDAEVDLWKKAKKK